MIGLFANLRIGQNEGILETTQWYITARNQTWYGLKTWWLCFFCGQSALFCLY